MRIIPAYTSANIYPLAVNDVVGAILVADADHIAGVVPQFDREEIRYCPEGQVVVVHFPWPPAPGRGTVKVQRDDRFIIRRHWRRGLGCYRIVIRVTVA